MTFQTDVPHEFVEVPVGALALHTAGQPRQALCVLKLRSQLQALCEHQGGGGGAA